MSALESSNEQLPKGHLGHPSTGTVGNEKRPRCLECGRKARKARKPPSNPPGWASGKSSGFDLAKRPHRIVVLNGEQEAEFVPNMVRTAKYEYYDFLPKFLWEEFNPTSKIANVYFLFIAALQVVPSITNTFGIPLMLLPLFFVVCVDAIFMVIEDVARHRADHLANSSPTEVWDRRSKEFKLITWKDIEVGDLIVINNRDSVPCDVLIMGVDEPIARSPGGIAYVETKSLDGETNLKIRQVVKGVLGVLVKPEDCCSLSGRVVMEHPDKLINNFKGKLLLDPTGGNAESGCCGDVDDKMDHINSHGRSLSSSSPPCAESNRQSMSAKILCPEARYEADARGHSDDKTCSEKGQQANEKENGDALEASQRGSKSEPIGPDMLLLRGCVLRNTRWAVGLVLNTGPDTKIMMSMSKAPCKASHLSHRINQEIKRVAAAMGSVCVLGAALSTFWSDKVRNTPKDVKHLENIKYLEDKWYLAWENGSDQLVGMFFTQMLYYALLLNSFIPISLYVSMNFVRFLQSWFMNQDIDMYFAEADTPARVRTMNLNEDLGQVSHVFSDKTGTLTCNVMDFRKFSVGGVSYGLGITEIGRAAMVVEGEKVPEDVLKAEEKAKDHAAPHVNFYDPSAYKDLQGLGSGGKEQARRMRDFFTALALCHTVIPERFEDSDEVILSASSPDDEALVLGAKYFGFEFVNRIDGNAVLKTWDVTAPPAAIKSRLRSASCCSPRSPMGGGVEKPRSRELTRAGSTTADRTPASPRREHDVPGLPSDQQQFGPTLSASADLHHNTAALPKCAERLEKCVTSRQGRDDGHDGRDLAGAGRAGDTRGPQTSSLAYEVLHVLGFTSDRKRMSVIVRTKEGKIKVICKGADTVMLPRLRRDTPGAGEAIEETVKHMDTFAREGLRTLVVAQAELDPDMFEEWADRFEEASNNLEEIDKKNRGEANRIDETMDLVEQGLEIIGSSAIEDKLQAGVADAISDLMAAGIRIWVLTGDKEETAINIAVACQLLWTEERMHRTVIRLRGTGESEVEEIKDTLEDFLAKCIEERDNYDEDVTGTVGPPLPRGLVIDGPALLEAMQTPESQAALLRAAQACHSVVGCRMSPDQKRALVSLVRENVPGSRTLSIGDGANDVPMIQTAHIGVGISGQEGMQAVNASDYAISQFAYLRKLLLVHGRWNYRRSSRVVCYLFYKSIMFACPLIFYAYVNGYSGTLFYDYVTSNMYAVVYTALPILLCGTYDQDISAETCLRFPQLYAYGISGGFMRPKIFWSWMLQALLESAFLTLAPLFLLSGDENCMGVVPSTYHYGTLTFTLVVIQVSIKMYWVQYRWTRFHMLVLMGSVFAFVLSAIVVNAWILINWDYYGIVFSLIRSGPSWAVMTWCLSVVVGRDCVWKFHHRWWRPRLHHLVLESEKQDQINAAEENNATSPGSGACPGAADTGKVDDDTQDVVMAASRGGDLDAKHHELTMAQGKDQTDISTGVECDRYGTHHLQRDTKDHVQHHPHSRTAEPTPTPHTPVAPSRFSLTWAVPSGGDHGQGGRFLNRNRIGNKFSSTMSVARAHENDLSVKVLLESTFSVADTCGGTSAPLTMSALSETLRERRVSRPGNVHHGRSATLGSGGGNSSGLDGKGYRAARDVGRDGLSPARSADEGRVARDLEYMNEDAEWDPFESTLQNTSADALVQQQHLQQHLQRRKDSRMARHPSAADFTAGSDPREAAKLMRASSFVVDVEGGPTPSRRPSKLFMPIRRVRRGSSRRSSDGMAESAAASSRRTSNEESRRRSAVAMGSTAGAGEISNLHLRSATGHASSRVGFAFSCDAKAQQAEIAMILGYRPSPLRHTPSFYTHRSSLRAERIARARTHVNSAENDDLPPGEVETGPSADSTHRNSFTLFDGGDVGTSTLVRRSSRSVGSNASSGGACPSERSSQSEERMERGAAANSGSVEIPHAATGGAAEDADEKTQHEIYHPTLDEEERKA